MIFRVRYRTAHFLPHVYCALFVARGEDQTGAICGTFSVRAGEEWEALKQAFAGAEFIQDEYLNPNPPDEYEERRQRARQKWEERRAAGIPIGGLDEE